MSIKKYRLKPREVEVIQWTEDNLEEIKNFIDSKGYYFSIDKEYGEEMRLCVANDACSVAKEFSYIVSDGYFVWIENSSVYFENIYEEIK